MQGRIGLAAVLAGCLLGGIIRGADGGYVPPHQFVRSRNLREFPAYANEFLKNADREQAPQVLLDLIVVHGAFKEAESAQRAKAILVLDHPASFQAAYVMAGMGNPMEVSALLMDSVAAYRADNRLGRAYVEKLSQAILMARSQFGDPLFSNEEFRLLAIFALCESGYASQTDELLANYKTSKQQLRRAAELLADRQLSAADRFCQLQAHRETKVIQGIQAYYLAQLSQAEKDSARIEAAQVESLLADGKMDEALPRVRELLARQREARFLVWQGWALAAQGKITAAIESLQQAEREFAGDPWARPAAELRAALATHAENLAAHVAAMDEALSTLRSQGMEAADGKVRWRTEQGAVIEISFGADVARNLISASLSRGDQLLLAAQSSPAGARVYYAGDQAIHQYPDVGNTLQPTIRLDRTPDGKIHFFWHVGIRKSADGLGSLKEQLLDSYFLRDRRGIEELAASWTRRGVIPARPVTRSGLTIYRWLWPQAGSPELRPTDIFMDASGRIVRLDYGGGQCVIDQLRYGTSRELALTPASLPQLPILQHSEMGPELFRLLAAVSEIFWGSGEPPSATAANEQPMKR